MADPHFEVIDDIHKMKDITAIRALHDHVGRVGFIAVINRHLAANEVVHRHRAAIETESPRTAILINATGINEFRKPTVVNLASVALKIRTQPTANLRAFVPIQPKPFHPLKNRLLGLIGVSRLVGVLDAQHENSAVMAGKQPVEKGGAGATHMKVSGGRWREAGTNGHVDDVNASMRPVQPR